MLSGFPTVDIIVLKKFLWSLLWDEKLFQVSWTGYKKIDNLFLYFAEKTLRTSEKRRYFWPKVFCARFTTVKSRFLNKKVVFWYPKQPIIEFFTYLLEGSKETFQ